MKNRSMIVAVLMFMMLPGCAQMAADRILTFGSNGGGKPFPKDLDYVPIFNEYKVCRVQDNPPIDLIVWIIEPQQMIIWAGDLNAQKTPEAWKGKEIYAVCLPARQHDKRRLNVMWGMASRAKKTQPKGTIIILQGQGGCSRFDLIGYPLAAAMANAGYRVIMPDLRSQGDSTGRKLGYIVHDADDMKKVMDMLEKENLLTGRVGILGHSYGAAVGGYVASRDKRVSTCILSGTPMNIRGVVEFQGQADSMWRGMSAKDHEETFAICSRKVGFDIDTIDARNIIKKSTTPALLVHGRKDAAVPLEHSLEIYSARPANTKLVIYNDSRHGEYFTQHFEDFSSLCLDWFAYYLQGNRTNKMTFGKETRCTYVSRLQQTLLKSRSRLPEFTKSAEEASARFVAGGTLWVTGRQQDFIDEACGRAGGLMSIRRLGEETPAKGDIILYAAPGKLNDEDLKSIEQLEKTGALVIRFDSAAGMYDKKFPVDTVANVIDLWTWTGEFAAACMRRGRMPVFYQSYGMPGGRQRDDKYKGRKFHDDLQVKPVPAGVLGGAYLDKIDVCLAGLQQQQEKIDTAAKWWSDTPKGGEQIFIIGHMFPKNFQDSRLELDAQFTVAPPWDDKELLDEKNPPKFVLYLGYQYAPHKLIEQARRLNVKMVYSDVQPDKPAPPAENIVYINPGWPLDDGCVSVAGYDTPILPASGVITAATFWQILSEK